MDQKENTKPVTGPVPPNRNLDALTISSRAPITIPAHTTSLGATPNEELAPFETVSRAKKKTLKRKASSVNKYAEPEEWWNANDQLIRIDLDEAVQVYKEDKRLYEEGKIPQEVWDSRIVVHLGTQAKLREALSDLQKQRAELNKALHQNFELSPGPSQKFCSLLIEFLEKKERPNSREQSKFRQTLLTVHDALDAQKLNVYCPVVQRYMGASRVKAAHIYPYALGTTVMAMLFGDESIGELFDARNGLLLADFVEEAFDKSQLVIVPAKEARLQPNGTIDRWIIRIIDDSVRKVAVTDMNCELGDLDGRELRFKTEARPAARYLYFHYLLSILRARKHLSSPPGEQPIPWATPGKYMRERMVRALVAEAGHAVFQDRNIANVIPDGAEPDIGERTLAAHLIETPSPTMGEESDNEDTEL
jgi:hypothetical protein